jgi:alpha/beta superfamily hydrolase
MEFFLDGPAGALEALHQTPEGREPRAAALVCHPHPLHGGTLHNSIVFRTARALRGLDFAVLRFNFRGVGQSAGAHDGEGGEDEDARAAVDWLAERHPGLPLWGAGFSFGARTMARLARSEPRLERILLIALPIKTYSIVDIDRIEQPTYFLFGGRDEFGTRADFEAQYPRLPAHFVVEEEPLADHLYHGRTPLVEERVRGYAQRALEGNA